MNVRQAKKLARSELSKKRYIHTKNVARAARGLARQYGDSVKKAALAGYLHDILKERPTGELLKILYETAIISSIDFQEAPQIAHGFAAAEYIRRLGVTDERVIGAVRYHSTGRPNMTKLEKILFVADHISLERSYPDAEYVRKLAKKSLDEAVVYIIGVKHRFCEQKGRYIVPLTRATLDYYTKEKDI